VEVSQVRLSAVIEDFLLDGRARGLSKQTTRWYAICLERFLKWAGEDVGAEDALDKARGYVVSLREEGLASGSVGAYSRSIRVLFSWAYDQGYIKRSPTKILRPYRERQRVPDPLTDEDLKTVVECLPTPTSLRGCRNRVAFMLMFDSMMRVGELPGIKVSDVRLSEREILVLGKGNRERVVPIGDTTLKELRRYLRWRETANPSHPFLLVGKGNAPITTSGIQMFIKSLKRASGLDHLYPHLLRHTGAMQSLINGADSFSVQTILGHSTPAMTARYVHAAKAKLGQRHRGWSPIDHLPS